VKKKERETVSPFDARGEEFKEHEDSLMVYDILHTISRTSDICHHGSTIRTITHWLPMTKAHQQKNI
jgi:hypothetical protein